MRIQPKKIMCAVDFSDYTDMVLQYGNALGREFGSKLYLCHVVSPAYMVSSHVTPYVDYTGIESDREAHARDTLEKIRKELKLDSDILVEVGNPAETIARLATVHQIDMVLAATYGGSGIKRFLVGSVTDRLVKILSCPLLVLHPDETGPKPLIGGQIKLNRILVGCDFSRDSALAFGYGLSLAQEFQTQLYLAHVMPPTGRAGFPALQAGDAAGWNRSGFLTVRAESESADQERKTGLERQLLDMVPEESRSWCTPVTVILEGHPYRELLDYAQKEQVDMIVLGIRGHGLIETFFVGSTTDRIIGRAPCPVLAVRQTGDLKQAEQTGKQAGPERPENSSVILARDIMEKDVISTTPDTDITTAVKLLLAHHINGLPVLDGQGRLQGVLCQSDLIYQQKDIRVPPIFSMLDSFISLASSKQIEHEMEKISAIKVGQAMEKEPVTVRPDTPISKIAGLMVEKRVYTIPVVENGKLAGIIGQEDLLKVLL